MKSLRLPTFDHSSLPRRSRALNGDAVTLSGAVISSLEVPQILISASNSPTLSEDTAASGPACMVDDLRTILLRPEDLLYLEFEFRGLYVDRSHTPATVRKKRGERGLFIVHLPPQHIAEAAVPGSARGATEGDLPTAAMLARPSRLVFSVPERFEAIGFPYTVAGLLDWSAFTAVLHEAALPPVGAAPPTNNLTSRGLLRSMVAGVPLGAERPKPTDPVPAGTAQSTKWRDPTLTCLEIPTRLALSPHCWSRWDHSTEPARAVHGGRQVTELWHTRLTARTDLLDASAQRPASRDDLLTVRAVGWDSTVDPPDLILATRPSPLERMKVATESSDFTLALQRPQRTEKVYDPAAIAAPQLMLSTLGANARLQGTFDRSPLSDGNLDLTDYVHHIGWGRDLYVRIALQGYLLPFGHTVALLKVRSREFGVGQSSHSYGANTTALLAERYFLQVTKPELNYPDVQDGVPSVGRRMPFEYVAIEPMISPALAEPKPVGGGAWPTPLGSTAPLLFNVTVRDRQGRLAHFKLPMMFVAAGLLEQGASDATVDSVLTEYLKDETRRTAILPWTKLAFGVVTTERANNAKGRTKDTSLLTQQMVFSAERAKDGLTLPPSWTVIRTYPAVASARVDAVGGSGAMANSGRADSSGSLVSFHPTFVAHGFDPKFNAGEIFLNVQTEAQLGFASRMSAGMAAPSMRINALSRLIGPVGGGSRGGSDFLMGSFNPKEFFGAASQAAQLLGGVDLEEVIAPVADAIDTLERVPKLLRQEVLQYAAGLDHLRDSVSQALAPYRQTLANYQGQLTGLVARADAQRHAMAIAIRESRTELETKLALDARSAMSDLREQVVEAVAKSIPTVTQGQLEDARRIFNEKVDGAATSAIGFLSVGLRSLDAISATITQIAELPIPERAQVLALMNVLHDPQQLLGEARAQVHAMVEGLGARAKTAVDADLKTLGDCTKQLNSQISSAKTALEAQRALLRQSLATALQKNFPDAHQVVDTFLAGFDDLFKNPTIDDIFGAPLTSSVKALEQEMLRVLNDATAIQAELAKNYQTIADGLDALIQIPADILPRELTLSYDWHPTLQNAPQDQPLFVASLGVQPATLDMHAEIRQKVDAQAVVDGPHPTTMVSAEICNFEIRLLPSLRFVSVGIEKLTFKSVDGRPPDVSLKIGTVTLGEELSFIKDIAALFSPKTGAFLDFLADGVRTGFRFALPGFALGALSFTDLGIETGVNLPFGGGELSTALSLSSRSRPFSISVGILGGGGFFGLALGVKSGIQCIEGALEFGACAAIQLGVASGSVSIKAGIYFALRSNGASLHGYVRARGMLDVLGIITIRAEFYLGLGYESRDGHSYAVGEALVSVEIDILFFHKKVEIKMRREFAGSDGASLALGARAPGALPPPQLPSGMEWREYLQCFDLAPARDN